MLSNAIAPRELHHMIRIAAAVLLLASSPVLASPYCLPTNGRDRIAKTGSACPTGYFATGDCCEAVHADTKRAFPKIKGAACPSGTFASAGNYCVSF
jgi:hypothetical protein